MDGKIETQPNFVSTKWQRIELAFTRKGMSARVLASKLGVTTTSIYGWKKRDQVPLKRIPELARILDVDPNWLLFGESADTGFITNAEGSSYTKSLLKLAKTVAESIRSQLGAKDKDITAVQVSDDSMKPTLSAGQVLLIDKRHTKGFYGAIFAIECDDVFLIRRLTEKQDGIVLTLADNPIYPQLNIDLNDPKITVVGKAAWAFGSGNRL